MKSAPEPDMSPDASPGRLTRRTGVRRVNNLPLYILGGAMTGFLLIMASVAVSRGQQQRTGPDAPRKTGSAAGFAQAVVGEHRDGIIAPAAPPALQTPPAPAPQDQPAPQPAPASDLFGQPPEPAPPARRLEQDSGSRSAEDEAARIRTMKLQQLDEAVRASSRLQIAAPSRPWAGDRNGDKSDRSGDSGSMADSGVEAQLASVRRQIAAPPPDDPDMAYGTRLQAGQGAAPAGRTGSGGYSGFPTIQSGKGTGAGQGDRWRLDARLDAPGSPYELRAGFVIPAILISGINSELPGQIVAQVSQDVYDTPRGRWRLVPQGARLVGAYSSDVAYGQARVLVAWQRIVYPDGKAIDIGAMPGADGGGRAGFNDRVDNHYWRTFSSAFLMSAITAGIATSQREGAPYSRPGFGGAMGEAVGQQLGQVAAQLIARNVNVSPTLEIRPGYRFNVIVTRDLTFTRPYQPFDY